MRNMLKDHQDLKVRKPKYLSQIQDDRSPARPNTPWIEFLVERSNSDDFRGIELTDRVKLMSSEWKAFTEEEKKVRPCLPLSPLTRVIIPIQISC